MIEVIQPEWPAPVQVQAISTLRVGGVSGGPWESANLGAHCDDDRRRVEQNRASLSEWGVPERIAWLQQVHGARVISARAALDTPEADGSVANFAGAACAVLHADCLPILLCDRPGTAVAAVHAGWRGLAGGILRAALEAFPAAPENILAWLGPCIGGARYEVGSEVRAAVTAEVPRAEATFVLNDRRRWQFDLAAAARIALNDLGVVDVFGGHWCTATEQERFFSYRRDGQTGRMASLVWLQ